AIAPQPTSDPQPATDPVPIDPAAIDPVAIDPVASNAVGRGERAPESAATVILPQSLETTPSSPSSDRNAATVTPSKPVAARTITRKSRPALDSIDFGSELTSETKTSAHSYRVKVPDEQNALEPRNGAPNVPVRE